ncbi:unnamed protein product [Paramecium octaurelia]|uniref:Protein arginine methyltransferase NDUFAF7 n=1 Tax=Paramecium octaurelia TaxID=43137 RepID=A0A8S1TK68_PAROT|nr:unnamed protein product [Paramecium octaurelia]
MKLIKQFCSFVGKEIDIKQASLINIIRSEIAEKGAISFPRFWHHALLHEKFGYYMKQDVFNKDGDFVTSVEISQMFNELIGIWLLNTFQHIGVLDNNFRPTNQKMHILEFGPGLGTLSSNILRVFAQFNLLENLQYSYVEYSDYMRKKQQEAVLKQLQKSNIYPKFEYNNQKVEKFESDEVNLKWFKMYEHFLYEETREGQHCDPVLILAHEFFDALPINIFEYSNGQWCERLVGLDNDGKTLKFVLSNGPNQNVQKILNPDKYFSPEIKKLIKEGDTIEISPQSGVIVNSLAELIAKVGGAALIIDYGEKRAFSDSVRAIQRHKLMDKKDILNKPGDCDLSAYVNFMALEQAALKVDGIKVPEIMTQGNWLEQMGIQARLQILCKNANKATEKRLQSEYERLVHSNQMGSNFKFMSIHRTKNNNLFPFIQDAQQIYY